MTITTTNETKQYTSYEYQCNARTIGRNFQSLSAFIEHAKPGMEKYAPLFNAGWLGKDLKNYSEVITELNKWQTAEMEIVDGIIADLGKRIQTPTKRRRRATWKEQGDSFSFERALDRKERCWQGSRKVNRHAPRSVNIVFEFGANQSVDPKELLNKPAVAIAICDLLEAAGYIVRLIGHRRADGCWYTSDNESVNSVENIILKDEGQPLDKVAVVNAMTGWFYRTICFAARTNFPTEHHINRVDGGMGATRCILNSDTDHVVDNLDSAIIIKGSYNLRQIVKEAIERMVEMGIMESNQ